MRLANYEFAEPLDKKEWLNSLQMKVGLNYFGGKSIIGKYIFNNIFNLSVVMKKQGKKPDIFIDAFTGGGKIGLSIPYGWYDTIVINDLNYGVYSYYKCCKENHIALIYMIEKIGELMNREMFHLAAYIRSFGLNVQKWNLNDEDIENNEKPQFIKESEVIEPLMAAALTYWVTAGAFNGQTTPDSIAYNFTRILKVEGQEARDDKAMERKEIERAIIAAHKRIPQLHEQLNKQNYIIENLDYRELIKKYNGKEYHDIEWKEKEVYKEILKQRGEYDENNFIEDYEKFEKEHTHIIEAYVDKNKLWYFDPPYHPYCLCGGMDAPYADSFDLEFADEMTKILYGDFKDIYGKLEFFIKSDYDPVEALQRAEEVIKNEPNDYQINWYKQLLAMEAGEEEKKAELKLSDSNVYKRKQWYKGMISSTFKCLEEDPFCKVCVGQFDKGAINSEHKKTVGKEYIWCKGFPKGYTEIEGESAK